MWITHHHHAEISGPVQILSFLKLFNPKLNKNYSFQYFKTKLRPSIVVFLCAVRRIATLARFAHLNTLLPAITACFSNVLHVRTHNERLRDSWQTGSQACAVNTNMLLFWLEKTKSSFVVGRSFLYFYKLSYISISCRTIAHNNS